MQQAEKSLDTTNGWDEWRRHVLIELERNSKALDQMGESISELRTEVAMLKVKAGVWGAVSGIITVAILLAVEYLKAK